MDYILAKNLGHVLGLVMLLHHMRSSHGPSVLVCHTLILGPTRMADPNRVQGARLYTGTLYLHFFLFLTLVGPSRITESKYHIQKYKIKLPPWWCLHCQYIHSVLSPIYLYIYKNFTFQLHIQSVEPTVMNPY